MKHLRFVLAALLFSLPLAPSTHAGVILVLKLDGIDGDSNIPGHANEITISSTSFSAEQPAAGKDAANTGVGAQKASFSPLLITKTTDKASAQLFLRCALGTPIRSAKLSFLMYTPNTSAPPVEFFSVRLGSVFVTKYTVAGSNNDEINLEEVMFNFKQMLLTYTPPVGPQVSQGFDLTKNKPISSIPD